MKKKFVGTQYSLLKFYSQKCYVLTLLSNKKSIGSACRSIGNGRISAVTTIEDLQIAFNEHIDI